MTYYWFIIGGVSLTYGVLSLFLPQMLRRRRINRRICIPFDQLYERYFRNLPYDKELIRDLWREAASLLKLNEEKLRPSDRFDIELSCTCFPLTDLNEDLTLDRLRQHLYDVPRAAWPRHMKTLGDYVEVCASARRRRDDLSQTHVDKTLK